MVKTEGKVAQEIWDFAKAKCSLPGVALEELWKAVAIARKEVGVL